jgi:hypothetical protein
MKKNVIALVCATVVLMFSSQLSAQDTPISVGVKVGSSLSNYRLGGNMKSFNSKMNIGGLLGGFVKYDLSRNFTLQSGIDFYYKTSDMEYKSDESSDKYKYWGAEIPVYGIFQVKLGSGKGFVGAGPYLGYGISAKSDGVNLFKKNNETQEATLKRLDCGIEGIIGYDFDKDWQINASYQFGLTDQHKAKGGFMKSQSLAIGLIYKF